jgi:single-stranded-DNA-specific exonuclease
MQKKLIDRPYDENAPVVAKHSVLQRIFSSRGVRCAQDLEYSLQTLVNVAGLLDIEKAAQRLCVAIEQNQRILIVGDYDADGATSTAIVVRALKAFGAKQVDYLTPDRFHFGYGLSPELVAFAKKSNPDLLMTVDNGIVSFAGVDHANELGIDVIITDHHLAAQTLPKAYAIVNPNRLDDPFPCKHLAGCGVAFYVMLMLRTVLRKANWFAAQKIDEPNMAQFLDLLALGTVADVVVLDKNNRTLVSQGLRRIRAGKCSPGIKALLAVSKRNAKKVVASDLGFSVAPRLNAAGRLDDMRLGVECLLTDDPDQAKKSAEKLDALNVERRQIETQMKDQAFAALEKVHVNPKTLPAGLCLYDATWHQGVTGILASRVKERWHRPTVVFAQDDKGDLKGSARSISGLHIRNVFEEISKKHPDAVKKFGGHAMAAGITISRDALNTFKKTYQQLCKEQLSASDLSGVLYTDGELSADDLTLSFAELLSSRGPWGQGFPAPLFHGVFEIIEQRIVGARHLKLILSKASLMLGAIAFNVDVAIWPNHRCRQVKLAYRLDVNEFRSRRDVQLIVEQIEALA